MPDSTLTSSSIPATGGIAPGFSACRARGFTLTELLVVVAIMSIIAAISLPSITSVLNGGAMNQTAMEVEGTLELARQYAVAQNTYVWVAFNTQNVNNTDTVTIAIVASSDSTDPGVYGTAPSSAFTLVSKVRTFKQVQLKDAGSFTSTQVPSLPSSPIIGTSNALSSTAQFTIPIPGAGSALFTKSVQFTPSGEARNAVNPIDVIEFALQPAQNKNNVAVLRLNGITGQPLVYRE